jgi:hypothetical protein
MERTRFIAAAPIRSAFEAWQVVSNLLTDTLERSSLVPGGSVSKELTTLKGLGPALIAGGHLESKGLVLVDKGLHLTIRVLTADAALEVEENLNPVPGGASATEGWILYVPPAGPLDDAVATAVENSPHLSRGEPPTSAPAEKSDDASPSIIDLNALRSLGNKS